MYSFAVSIKEIPLYSKQMTPPVCHLTTGGADGIAMFSQGLFRTSGYR